LAKTLPYWHPDADLSSMQVFVHELKPSGVFNTPTASLPMFGFIYVADGEALVEVEKKDEEVSFYVKAGDILIIPESTLFAVKWYSGRVGFSGAFRKDFLKDSSYAFLHSGKALQCSFREDMPHKEFTDRLFAQMYEHFMAFIRLGSAKDKGFVSSALDLVLAQADSAAPPMGNKTSEHFLELIFSRKGPVGPVSYYAEQLGVTPDALNRSVHKHTSRSAGEWISQARLAWARQLLRRTDLPLSEIAARIGLEDQSYFSRFFRKHEGMTPMEYRKWK